MLEHTRKEDLLYGLTQHKDFADLVDYLTYWIEGIAGRTAVDDSNMLWEVGSTGNTVRSVVGLSDLELQKWKWSGQYQQSLRKCRGTQVEMARAEPAKVSQVQEYTDHTAVVKG